MLLLMMLFCLDCRFWLNSKINYVFVFEFDTRHHLDWRQLFEVRISRDMYILFSLTKISYRLSF